MAVDGIHFLEHASNQLEHPKLEEIQLRNAVSLAYYSVYHTALALADKLREIPLSSMSGSSHKGLSDFFMQRDGIRRQLGLSDEDVRFMRLTGGQLRRLHEQRVVADYRIHALFELAAAQEALQRCRKVIDDLREFESRLSLTEA